ncbi:MAG: ribbon-helix-helix protein, CopG family [Armatimonadetes bacterium]|nr:ribbon-helix-helix protein, CopG family [Armatimonadota bacterium]
MKRTTITLPDDLADIVAMEARRQGTSVSGLIQQLVRQSLMGTPERRRQIPWAGIFHDSEMIAGDQVEQALAESWPDEIDRDR